MTFKKKRLIKLKKTTRLKNLYDKFFKPKALLQLQKIYPS